MKYVYIITRITHSESPYVTHIPNLGVHTSFTKALSHYKSVLEDRERYEKVEWDRDVAIKLYENDNYIVVREARILHSDRKTGLPTTVEFLRLEQWKVTSGNKKATR